MSKILITILVIAIVVIIATLGWWLFNKTNSVTFQTSNTTVQQSDTSDQTGGANNQPSGITETANQSSDKSITSFVFSGLTPKVDGVIDNINYAINLTVSSDTDVTSLTPTISVSGNATVSPLSGVAPDFTNPVIYSVTAQDGSTQNYTVTVTPVSVQ